MKPTHLAFICLLALLVPQVALAHSPIEGIGNFLNGILHPILIPAHLLLLVALGFHLGQQGNQHIELCLITFALATITGLAISWFVPDTRPFIGIKSVSLVLALASFLGLLVAIKPQLPKLWYGIVALVAGCLLGIDSAQEALMGKDKFIALLGSGIAIYFLVLYAIVIADYANKKDWLKIGIRVIGSWIAASSVFVLVLSYKLSHL